VGCRRSLFTYLHCVHSNATRPGYVPIGAMVTTSHDATASGTIGSLLSCASGFARHDSTLTHTGVLNPADTTKRGTSDGGANASFLRSRRS
jgi:hypothetical protein